MAALAVVIAFCSASQDIVFDAWKTDVLPAEERGAGAAISVLGYRLGMLVSGGLALWLADKWLGWQGHVLVDGGAVDPPVLSRRCLHQNPPTPFLCPKRWNKRLLHLCEISLVAIMPGLFCFLSCCISWATHSL